MLRSIAVERTTSKGSPTPAATFLRALHWDLARFGRSDVSLFDVGNLTVFVWDPDFKAVGSQTLRETSLAHRLAGTKDVLEAIEASLPPDHFQPFDLDFAQLDLEIVDCPPHSANTVLFDYVALGQSVAAETQKMRIGKFLVYDRSRNPRRLLGVIALKSPMYFDGARDRHLDWPPLFMRTDNKQVKSQPAIDLRNQALKSIYNIAVCMPIAPYDQRGVAKLLAALCLSEPVISRLENYGDPILGLTTTGAWGGSAGQYERIRLALDQVDGLQGRLFVRTHGAARSLNYPFHLYSNDLYDLAYALLRDSQQSARSFVGYQADDKLRRKLLIAACRLVGVPRRVIATNVIAHYFGAVSQGCRAALATLESIAAPPAARSLAVTDILADWKSREIPAPLTDVRAVRLSAQAT